MSFFPAEVEAEEPAAEADYGPTPQPHLGDQLHAGCQELSIHIQYNTHTNTGTYMHLLHVMDRKIWSLTGRVTGYHRLAEAALYGRNWDFGNINPFPEEDIKQ